MNEREKTIRLWFDMWLNQQDMGIDDIEWKDKRPIGEDNSILDSLSGNVPIS